MDIKYFGAMLLRGIGQSGMPIKKIEIEKENNSQLYVLTKDDSQFLVHIESIEEKEDILFHSLYEMFTENSSYNRMMKDCRYNISWLKEKLSYEEYYKLEKEILDFSFQNDEIFFKSIFRYTWRLFYELILQEENENDEGKNK